jgi:hypothetical protein
MSEPGYYFAEKKVSGAWRPGGIWFFDCNTVMNVSSNTLAVSLPVSAGEAVEEVATRYFKSLGLTDDEIRITKSRLSPGEFYHQIARPMESQHWESASYSLPGRWPTKQLEAISHQGHLRTLMGLLDRILLVVSPTPDMLSTYGYEIRNLLILACTECEAQWRAVLQANGYIKSRYNTNDYVKLEPVMRLREYEIGFRRYPSIPAVKPFASWGLGASPTNDLVWYDSYNAAKHDRIGSIDKANLENAMTSLAACWIMLVAQYGGPVMGDAQDVREYFDIKSKPKWEISESYIFHVIDAHHRGYSGVNYPFS